MELVKASVKNLLVINCIFIMLATYISVKYLKFREADFADAADG